MILCVPSVAGFLPYSEAALKDFKTILNLKGVFYVVDDLQIPWRSSVIHENWRARSIQGIDLSPLLFGLSAQENALGRHFFKKYSNLSY
jgi:hypothetical protein